MIRALVEQTFDSQKKYFVLAGTSSDSKPTSGLITGSEFHEVDTGLTYQFDEAGASWHVVGLTPAEIQAEIDAWLDDHPEATTTVEDGAITYAKLNSSLQGTVNEVGDLKSAYNKTIDSDLLSAFVESNPVFTDGADNIIDLPTQQESDYSASLDYSNFGATPKNMTANQSYWFNPGFVSGTKYTIFVHYLGESNQIGSSNIRLFKSDGATLVKQWNATTEESGTYEFTSVGGERIRFYISDPSVFKVYALIAIKSSSDFSAQFSSALNAVIGSPLKNAGHINSSNYNTLIPDINNAPVNTYYTGFTGDVTKLPSNLPVSTTLPFVVRTYGTNGFVVFQEVTYYSNSTSLADNQLSGSTWRRVLTGTPGGRTVFYGWISADETQNSHIRAIENQVRPVITVDKSATENASSLIYNNFYKAMKYAYENNCDVDVKAGNYDLVAEYIAVEGQSAYDAINNVWKGTPIGHGMTVRCAAEAYFTMKNTASTSANYLTIGQWLAPLLPLDGGFRIEGWNIDAKNTRYVVHDGGYNNSDVFCNHEIIGCQMKLDNTDFEGQQGLQTYKTCIGGGLLSGGIHVIVKDCIFDSENLPDYSANASYHNVSDTAEGATSYNTYEISGCYFRTGTARCTYHGTETPVSPFRVHDCFLRASPIYAAEAAGDTIQNMELLAWNNTIQASN